MSIHRRFNPWGHLRIGDAAAVTPPASTQTDAVASAKQTGFMFGALVGVGFAVGVGYLLHDNKKGIGR